MPHVPVPAVRRPSSVVWLTVLGLATVAAYLGFFVLPFRLDIYYATPLLDLGKLTRYGIEAAVAYAAAIVLLYALYYAGYLLLRARPGRTPAAALLLFPLAAALGLIFTYPFTAADIFHYIVHARLWTVYGANPMATPANAFPLDPFLKYAVWWDPSRYGPVWQLVSWPASVIGDTDLLRSLVAFKALAVLFLGLDSALVYAVLRRWRPERAALGVYLLAWNPLALLDVAANGHNDIVMVFFVLVAVWAIVAERDALVLPALTLGVLVKFTPAVLAPLALAYLIRRAGRDRRRWAILLGSALASLALAGFLYAPFWGGAESLGFLRQGDLFTASPGNLLRLFLEPRLGEGGAAQAARYTAYGAFLLGYLWLLPRAWRDKEGVLTAFFWSNLLFIVLATLWFQSWYVLWLLPLAAVLPERGLQDRAVLLSFGALASYEVFIYVWVMNWYTISIPTVQLLACAAIYGPLLLYSLAAAAGRAPEGATIPSSSGRGSG